MIKTCGYPVYYRCSEEQQSIVKLTGATTIPTPRLTAGSRICFFQTIPGPGDEDI
ncbi:MAG: hypothetical protein LBD58_02275 [Treponema sp.]|nr:hypothetical protein [Treponema sp.]